MLIRLYNSIMNIKDDPHSLHSSAPIVKIDRGAAGDVIEVTNADGISTYTYSLRPNATDWEVGIKPIESSIAYSSLSPNPTFYHYHTIPIVTMNNVSSPAYTYSRLVLCDIDGVLANISHRLHYLKRKDYDSFYSEAELADDTPNPLGLTLLYSLALSTTHVVFITGRPERTMKPTLKFLSDNYEPFYATPKRYNLVMRPDRDYCPSPELKCKQINELVEMGVIKPDTEAEFFFIDDDPFNCLAVADKYPYIQTITFGTERM